MNSKRDKETLHISVYSKIEALSGDVNEMTLYTEATYRHERNKAFLMYEETELSGMEGTKTLLTYDGVTLQIKRYGQTNSLLRIEKGIEFENNYQTPYGTFIMKTTGESILWEDSGQLSIELVYKLDINEDVSNVTIKIKAERK